AIERQSEHAIEPLVRDQHEFAARVEDDVVGVRACLLDRIWTGLARQRHHPTAIRKPAVGLDGEERDVAARIVRNDREPAAHVERKAYAIASPACRLIEQGRLAGADIEPKGAGEVAIAVRRVEKSTGAAERQPGGIGETADVLDGREITRRRIEAPDVQ